MLAQSTYLRYESVYSVIGLGIADLQTSVASIRVVKCNPNGHCTHGLYGPIGRILMPRLEKHLWKLTLQKHMFRFGGGGHLGKG